MTSATPSDHYLPKFYTKGWVTPRDWVAPKGRRWPAASKDKVWFYRRNGNHPLVPEYGSPINIACEDDLNTVRPEFPFLETSRVIETKTFQEIDREGARVINALRKCTPKAGPDKIDREALARFAISLVERHRDVINDRQARMKGVFEATVARMTADAPDKGSRRRFRKFFKMADQKEVERNFPRRQMVEALNDPARIDQILALEWVLLVRDEPTFIATDRPLVTQLDNVPEEHRNNDPADQPDAHVRGEGAQA